MMSCKILLFIFVFVFLNGDLLCDDALSMGDENVCLTTVKELRNFNITFFCGKDKKVCQRTKQRSEPVLKYICCTGWKSCNGKCIKESDVCVSPKCVNGIYKDKNCTCDYDLIHLNETHCGPKCSDGYYNDRSTTNFTCISKCSEPCVNGICTDFDTCTCDPDLVHFNGTHCGPKCLIGLHNDLSVASLPCVPDCSHPCVNGNCTDIDTCTCDPGLIHLNKTHCGPKCPIGFHNDLSVTSHSCVPDCSHPCVNGNCTDIDTCTCDPGLIHLNKTHCGPKCPIGFHNDLSVTSLSCVFDCSHPCVNGNCTNIDTCTCDPGLVHFNGTHCGPKCPIGFHNDRSVISLSCVSDCGQPCVNGNCTDIDTCTCDPGLIHLNKTHCGPKCPIKFHNDLSVTSLSCVSDCSQPCVNGNCTDIDTCTCDPGLIHLNKTHCGPKCPIGFHNDLSVTSLSCVSDCSHPCVNGNCTDIDTCTCDPGLIHLNKTHCGPKCPIGFHNDLSVTSLSCVSDCSQPCVNGNCTDIDTCTCDPGLIHLNKTHCGPKCPIGFHNDLSVSSLPCVPDCSHPCVNGNCTDIDTCTCDPGLIHFNKTHCGPKCPIGFHNNLSVASLPCVPDCSHPCVNGNCTDIDTCTCDLGLIHLNKTHCGPKCPIGFHNNLSVTSLSCVSDCSHLCVNGNCTDIDTCTCDPGLVHFNSTHCGPKCLIGFHNDLSVTSLPCILDCSHPCVNGNCTDIDTCTCVPGLVYFNITHCGPECSKGFHNDLSVTSLSCVSDCSHPCVNGNCTDIDTCTCDPDLVNFNGTHCGPKCLIGFHNDLSVASLPCVPDCSHSCVNGNCTDIDTCTCDPGLIHLNKTHCGPKCPIGFHNDLSVASLSCVSDCRHTCVNGNCTDIDTCTCDPGLIHLNKTHCGPKCLIGFHNDLSVTSLSCVSDCSHHCVNGNCTDIDTCTCDPGLVPLNISHCGPKCSIGFHYDRYTTNFNCLSNCIYPCVNGICTDIDTCTCDTGLVHFNKTHCGPKCPHGFHNNLSAIELFCISDCSQPCVNGICTNIDTCTCDFGLVYFNKTHCGPECSKGLHNDLSVASLPCIYDCTHPCVNGNCTDIDTCTCDPGLVHLNKTHCGPKCPIGFHNDLSTTNFTCISKCSEPCVNGICTDIDMCICNPGLVHLNKTHCGPKCPIGFHNDRFTTIFFCISKCSRPCVNGICIDFDKCKCNEGYKAEGSSRYECEPECENCPNGVCREPNKCTCDEGYFKNNDDICEPMCSKPCVNGYCSTPENCECNAGYFYYKTVKSCMATCKVLCVNATCVAPDECDCWTGYVRSNVSNICKPYCSHCSNEECIEPEVCHCNEGYNVHNNSCEQYHKEALSASFSWIPVYVIGILIIIIALAVIIRTWQLRCRRKRIANDEQFGSAISSTGTFMGEKYQCKYNKNGADEIEIRLNTDLPRVSSFDYIEKL